MKKQNKIKISKKLIVNIKYDLVQCKQINIACRIHLLNRKKKDSCSTFATTIFNLLRKQMETTQSKSISKIRIYISQKDRQKNHAGFLADNGNLLQIWM